MGLHLAFENRHLARLEVEARFDLMRNLMRKKNPLLHHRLPDELHGDHLLVLLKVVGASNLKKLKSSRESWTQGWDWVSGQSGATRH